MRSVIAMVVAATAVLCVTGQSASTQQHKLKFSQLPAEIRNHVKSVRDTCIGHDGRHDSPYDLMQGIDVIDLDGDGSRDVMVDDEYLCNTRTAGANCTNRGCDLTIWKQKGRRSWEQVFREHLHRKFISLAPDRHKFQLMAISIYAGNPHCKPAPNKEYSSGQSCDVLVRYHSGKWRWQKIE